MVGIDIGTSATKGCIVDLDGTVLHTVETAHRTSMPRPGWFEHHSQMWTAEFASVCRQLLTEAGSKPLAVCASGVGPCLLATTAAGDPLRPAILYGIDSRATEEIGELNRRIGEEEILRRGGSPLTSQAVGPKVMWLRRHEPDAWSQFRRFFMPSSYLVHFLTGEYVLDHHSASQCNPMYDLEAAKWAGEMVELIAPNVELPRLVWPGEIVGRVHSLAASQCGLEPGTPVLAGTVDAWAEAWSVDVQRPGELMLMYGSTMFMTQVTASPRPDRRLWTTRGVAPDTYTLAAGLATSGSVTAWFQQIAGRVQFETLLSEAAGIPSGSDGVIVLPYFAGERTPIFDPQARGVIFGLTLRHGRGHLYRAILEGAAYAVRHNLETMSEIAGSPTRIASVGGGTRGHLWTQIVSDVCRIDQEVHQHALGASYGDARMAASSISPGQTAEWNPVVALIRPDATAEDRYNRLYAIFRELYPATATQAHRLAELSPNITS